MESLTASIDAKHYGRLLAKTVPRIILTKEEHERTLAIVESLLEKGERNMSAEEDTLLDLLTKLIRDYEAAAYRSRAKSKSHELVAFLLAQGGKKASDLWPVIGSRGRVSDMLSGKREISKEQARKLANFFNVGIELFIR